MPLLTTLIFISVAAGLIGAGLLLAPSRVGRRLRALAPPPEPAAWTSTVAEAVRPFALLSTPEGEWESSPLRVRFLNAGIRRADARLLYFGAKTLLPLVLAGLAFTLLRGLSSSTGLALLLQVTLAALAGCYLPNVVVGLMARHRQRDMFETFPDAADLMLVCVEAGLGLDAAMTRVADEIRIKSAHLADELQLTNLELRAGASREQALRHLALRTGIEEVGIFGAMLSQADKFGTSIGDSLRVFSDDLRHKRLVRAEEIAVKIPTKMLLPLVLCIFPSALMVVLGPAVIQIVRTVLPAISHGA
ncbi:MAG TPA: type II secretion system F family protein [Telluria sp.]|nr:type II secretion system F family protein [Telluria sp.]